MSRFGTCKSCKNRNIPGMLRQLALQLEYPTKIFDCSDCSTFLKSYSCCGGCCFTLSKSDLQFKAVVVKIIRTFNLGQLFIAFREALKKVWNFPYFPKPTHPTHLVWKKIKIAWSKNHF